MGHPQLYAKLEQTGTALKPGALVKGASAGQRTANESGIRLILFQR